MQLAVNEVAEAEVVTRAHLLKIHIALMEQTETPELAGQVRQTQNWIGATTSTPAVRPSFHPRPRKCST